MKKAEDYVMSPSELGALKEEMNDASGVLQTLERDQYGEGTRASEMIDRNALRAQVRKYDALVTKYAPKAIRGATKDKLAKRSKELAQFIQDGMPSFEEMNNLKKHPGTPWKNLNWEKSKAQAIYEWKQCQRRLCPGDPTASSVEMLRRR